MLLCTAQLLGDCLQPWYTPCITASTPPEMETDPLKMACGYPCGVVIKTSCTCIPLTLCTVLVNIQLHLKGDPHCVQMGNVTMKTTWYAPPVPKFILTVPAQLNVEEAAILGVLYSWVFFFNNICTPFYQTLFVTVPAHLNVEEASILGVFVQLWVFHHGLCWAEAVKQSHGQRWCHGEDLPENRPAAISIKWGIAAFQSSC